MTHAEVPVLAGDSRSAQDLRASIDVAIGTDHHISLIGEPGAGFEDIARSIHAESKRSTGPFVVVDMAAIPENLAAAELFGFVRGAFTGAVSDRAGVLASAHRGTVFLNDLSRAPKDAQAMLLRVLTQREVMPIGAARPRQIDVRVIAGIEASGDDIAGDLRVDLFYRIRGFEIRVPPLRERRQDLGAIASAVARDLSSASGHGFVVAKDAVAALRKYDFPGNLRELESILSRAALISENATIHAKDLPIPKANRKQPPELPGDANTVRRELDAAVRELEAFRARAIAAEPIWQGRHFTTEKDYCFVLMPFAEMRDLQPVYRNHIKPVIEKCGLRCERADDIYDISGVMQSVWEGINRARLILADLTERNANVFYELGIAHTLGKPVIMLTQHIDYVPFDLRHLRCIVYDYTPPGITKLQDTLERTIRRALSIAEVPRFATLREEGGA